MTNKEITNIEMIDQKEMTAIPAVSEGQSTLDPENPVCTTTIDVEKDISTQASDTQAEAPESNGSDRECVVTDSGAIQTIGRTARWIRNP